MKFKDYEILINSSSQEVKEVSTLNGDYAFIGVIGESYSIQIKNNNPDYRIWAGLSIDGISALLGGYGFLIMPNSLVSFRGFQIDANTQRDFVFVDNKKDSVAYSKGNIEKIGIIEINIVTESIKWCELAPPPIMEFMATGMGESRDFNAQEAKTKFNWGGPSYIIEIPYGTMSELISKQIIDKNLL